MPTLVFVGTRYNVGGANRMFEIMLMISFGLLLVCPYAELVVLILCNKYCTMPKSILVLQSIKTAILLLVATIYLFIFLCDACRWLQCDSYYNKRRRARKIFNKGMAALRVEYGQQEAWNIITTMLARNVNYVYSTECPELSNYFANNLSWRLTSDDLKQFEFCRCFYCHELLAEGEWVICKMNNRKPAHLFCRSKVREFNTDWRNFLTLINTKNSQTPFQSIVELRRYLFLEQVERLSAAEIADRQKSMMKISDAWVAVKPSNCSMERQVRVEEAIVLAF